MQTEQPIKSSQSFFQFLYKYGTIVTVFLLIIIFTILEPRFIQADNLISILRSISIVTIIAIGITISLTVNGFDLSVGSTASLANAVVMSMFVWFAQDTFIAIISALLVALLVGLFNTFMIVKLKVPDMLLTLATMFIIQGVALTYTKGATISQNMVMPDGSFASGEVPQLFQKIGQVPWIILIMVIIVFLVHIFLNYTKHGRYMYMIGGNEEAARLSGIAVNKYKLFAYLLSASFAAIGGILLASRVMRAEINAGSPYLMEAVAAAFIGFAVLGKGKPNAFGTFVGAVLIGILANGLVMLSVPYYAMDIVKGTVLAFALALTYYKQKN
ncbi:sugar ABC transporter permease [Alkalihalobacillus alcalophilus ATCC 27647 = CGMCC 1.3604]|uniref:Sugar ABC transporter permease n=1 Tax=Alkalihalobacillus alcalophilus ATCC 27647 = CGMCC 1.3604 TaxID=1218173 RepID=J8TNP2_ALKAL|nr:ABC transporter permease [Alkalihalobacillus alcalophilus]AFV25877.1 sugar transporter [Alkalihalobacillus alcalophilus ATCC 27647 = CGMCC 1.3604]KGA96547.1 sugar ABC transporter permease [Alkalihalobacillus alcalophilus ATCC 27647 = CGMCC 1.3604]MED1564145.1 ABC transporter permease [Alkalihalobacillus alcalophilus]THG91844.1 sugar ABC transporter permease [Alkalihalobacillus alcalophilus ATCC 27647 = CGMCC 1.3604]